jgi:predicted kinase
MTKKIILCKGLPASGKSTWSRELIDKEPEKWKRTNKDDLRLMLDNNKWSKKNEQCVLKVRDLLIKQFMEDGYNILIDDTNLDSKHEKRMRELIEEHNTTFGHETKQYELEVKFFDISLSEAIDRDNKRTVGHVGQKVIRGFYNKYIAPLKRVKKLEQDPSLPHCIICDIDGTIAEKGDRDIYDTTKVLLDTPREDIINIVRSKTCDVIFFSGRKEAARQDTEKWIDKYVFNRTFRLFMRKDDDNRKDSIVKKELFDTHIRGKYFVEFWLDDRQTVVNMIRNELGLTCLQVAEGDF